MVEAERRLVRECGVPGGCRYRMSPSCKNPSRSSQKNLVLSVLRKRRHGAGLAKGAAAASGLGRGWGEAPRPTWTFLPRRQEPESTGCRGRGQGRGWWNQHRWRREQKNTSPGGGVGAGGRPHPWDSGTQGPPKTEAHPEQLRSLPPTSTAKKHWRASESGTQLGAVRAKDEPSGRKPSAEGGEDPGRHLYKAAPPSHRLCCGNREARKSQPQLNSSPEKWNSAPNTQGPAWDRWTNFPGKIVISLSLHWPTGDVQFPTITRCRKARKPLTARSHRISRTRLMTQMFGPPDRRFKATMIIRLKWKVWTTSKIILVTSAKRGKLRKN